MAHAFIGAEARGKVSINDHHLPSQEARLPAETVPKVGAAHAGGVSRLTIPQSRHRINTVREDRAMEVMVRCAECGNRCLSTTSSGRTRCGRCRHPGPWVMVERMLDQRRQAPSVSSARPVPRPPPPSSAPPNVSFGPMAYPPAGGWSCASGAVTPGRSLAIPGTWSTWRPPARSAEPPVDSKKGRCHSQATRMNVTE
jgi:hypothetical protein